MTLLTKEALAEIRGSGQRADDAGRLLAHIDAQRAWLESEEAVKLLRDLTADYEYVSRGEIELDKDGYARAALAAIREKLT